MAEHTVRMRMKADLGYRDVEFAVKSDGYKLGEIHVSQGSFEWYRKVRP